VYEV